MKYGFSGLLVLCYSIIKVVEMRLFCLFMKLGTNLLFAVLFWTSVTWAEIDDNGYILYCPCMGRFGNQADHFLGALAFAHGLNRTLALPPWVEYRFGDPKSIQVPFDQYFQVSPLLQYHRVITMEKFMLDIAEKIWLPTNRTAFCYVSRGPTDSLVKTCNPKEGNPFGPFWDTFEIDFMHSEFYAPLNYDVYRDSNIEHWNKKYPADVWPVIAFTGAPASFPVQAENRYLQKYLKWNTSLILKAKQFIKNNMPSGGFIGIHLRNGADWVRACQHVGESPLLFAAPQCVGYRNERGPLTSAMCFPSKQDIVRLVKRLLKQTKDIRYIYVASDANHMIEELTQAHKRQNITVCKLQEPNPHLDLVILGQSNHFVGNCVSSFSAFVKRERDSRGLPSSFWAFPSIKHRDEL